MKRNSCIIILLALTLMLGACSGGSGGESASMPASSGVDSAAPEQALSEAEPQYSPDAQAESAEYHDEEFPAASDNAADAAEDYARQPYDADSESYLTINENAEMLTRDESVLTFSLKVDTASYTNMARYIQSGSLPPRDAVRTEELLNYFSYDQALNFAGEPFAIYAEVGPSPFDSGKHMAFVRVKTQDVDKKELPDSNLTFLIDTSGSMDSHDKLPLLKQAFSMLAETLDEADKVSIVTYAGSSAVLLDSVSGADTSTILNAIQGLEASGSTAGAKGILTAYALAEKNFAAGGNNRVILATDGDFNVGVSDLDELEALVAEKRKNGVYLSVLGFGTGNIRDDIMETLSTHGNGNYSYINSASTAKKVLVDELGSNLFTVADDVKAQIEFNPRNVKSYRLIGYEHRMLDNKDFDDDTKDAGEIGVGTDVVMLFELELESGVATRAKDAAQSESLFEVRIRYKNPGAPNSNLLTRSAPLNSITQGNSSDYRFACSVAAFGQLLRISDYSGDVRIGSIIDMAKNSLGDDPNGYRLDHLVLLKQCQDLLAAL